MKNKGLFIKIGLISVSLLSLVAIAAVPTFAYFERAKLLLDEENSGPIAIETKYGESDYFIRGHYDGQDNWGNDLKCFRLVGEGTYAMNVTFAENDTWKVKLKGVETWYGYFNIEDPDDEYVTNANTDDIKILVAGKYRLTFTPSKDEEITISYLEEVE